MITTPNQNPEQISRDLIDAKLHQAGWVVQSKNKIDLSGAKGVAIREYQTSSGPADYVLFVDRKPLGVIEAKREEEGERLTVVEDQSFEYATSKLNMSF
ncbi:MAG: type I restriction endonuclease [Cyclobacteriaceae bacterium]